MPVGCDQKAADRIKQDRRITPFAALLPDRELAHPQEIERPQRREKVGIDSGYWYGYRLVRVQAGGVTTDAVGGLAFDLGLRVFELVNREATLEEAFLDATGASEEFRASMGFGGPA